MKTLKRMIMWVGRIGWTDLGASLALIGIGGIAAESGDIFKALFFSAVGLAVYVNAPRAGDQ